MNKAWLQLQAHWFNRTVVVGCGFTTSEACNNFEPKVVMDLLKSYYKSVVREVKVTEGTFGRRNSKGHFDGFLGRVQDGEYDIALSPIVIFFERFDVIGFTRPYIVDGVKFAVRKGRLSDVSSVLIRPFKWEVWLALFFCVVLCLLSMTNRARKFRVRTSLTSMIFILWQTFLQKGCDRSRYFRIPLLMWSFLSFMLAQQYHLSLQLVLTTPSRVPVISTLEELNDALSRKNATRICLQKEGVAHYGLETRASPLSIRLKSALLEDPESQSNLSRCSARLTREENLVTIVEGARMHLAAETVLDHPQVQISSENLDTFLIAAASSKNAASLPYFDQLISLLLETGIFQRHLRMRELTKPVLPEKEETLGIGKGIMSSLKGFEIAYGIGICCLLFEIAAHRFEGLKNFLNRKKKQSPMRPETLSYVTIGNASTILEKPNTENSRNRLLRMNFYGNDQKWNPFKWNKV